MMDQRSLFELSEHLARLSLNGDPQNAAYRLDPVTLHMGLHAGVASEPSQGSLRQRRNLEPIEVGGKLGGGFASGVFALTWFLF